MPRLCAVGKRSFLEKRQSGRGTAVWLVPVTSLEAKVAVPLSYTTPVATGVSGRRAASADDEMLLKCNTFQQQYEFFVAVGVAKIFLRIRSVESSI